MNTQKIIDKILDKKLFSFGIVKQNKNQIKKNKLIEEIENEINYAEDHGYDYTQTDEYVSKRRQLEEL